MMQTQRLDNNSLALWLAYVLTGTLGLRLLSMPPDHLNLIWLASGIGVLLFLNAGRHAFWMVASASFLVNSFSFWYQAGNENWHILAMSSALMDVLQAWLSWEVLRRLHSHRRTYFTRRQDLLPFLLGVAALPALFTRCLLVLGLGVSGVLNIHGWSMLREMLQFAVGDALGIMLILPFFWTDYRSWPQLGRLLLWLPSLFLPVVLSALSDPFYFALSLPISVAIILRHHFEGALVSVLFTALMAMAQMAGHYGVFSNISSENSYFHLMLIVFCFAIPMLYLGLGLRENQIHHNHLDELVQHRTAELEKVNQKLQTMTMTDELTGLMSRRYWFEILHKSFENSRRHQQEMGLLYLDLDHFKQVNDTYGHPVGDEVLKAVGKALLGALRSGDYAGRIGGEELAIILPLTSAEATYQVGEKIRQMIQALEIQTLSTAPLKITVSVGCTAREKADTSEDELVLRADQALYLAKQRGRNRSEFLTGSAFYSEQGPH